MTVHLDLCPSRNETWRDTIDLPYLGGALPLTGATIRMQWRHYEGAPGAPLLNIINVPFEDLAPTSEDVARGVPAEARILRLSPVVAQSALEAMPTGLNQPEPGEADRYVWDAIILYADGATDRPVQGFIYLNKGTVRG
ncbi:MAG: hypothetical protein ABIV36_07875 [Sphingobium limneticum]